MASRKQPSIISFRNVRTEPDFQQYQDAVRALFVGPLAETVLDYWEAENRSIAAVEGDPHMTYFYEGRRSQRYEILDILEGRNVKIRTEKNLED